MAHQQLTDAIVKRLPPPEQGSKIYYDDVPGFGARITSTGARAYVLRYRVRSSGRERSFTIGDCQDWSVGQARKEARRLRQLIDQGGDPLGDIEAEREAPTMAALIDRFDAEHIDPRTRPGTTRAYRALLSKHVRPHFGKHTKVADVTFADIDRLHRKITASGAPYAANRTMAVLSKMFTLAARWGMRDDNPVRGVERNYESKRKRYLDGPELARLAQALTAHSDRQVVDIIRLLLLTGARVGEVLSMQWADVSQTEERDPDGNVIHKTVWTKLASVTKQEEDHIVPLSAPAAQLLTEIRAAQGGKHRVLPQFVFPSTSSDTGHIVSIERAWRTICAAAAIEGLRVHDLRHSVASILVSGGASLPLIGAILGHSNPASTQRYAHLFMSPQEAAVEKVGAVIAAAGKTVKEPAVPFKRGGRRA
jgi:integrase